MLLQHTTPLINLDLMMDCSAMTREKKNVFPWDHANARPVVELGECERCRYMLRVPWTRVAPRRIFFPVVGPTHCPPTAHGSGDAGRCRPLPGQPTPKNLLRSLEMEVPPPPVLSQPKLITSSSGFTSGNAAALARPPCSATLRTPS